MALENKIGLGIDLGGTKIAGALFAPKWNNLSKEAGIR